jgi:cytochrome c oxidase subunit IV
MKSLFRQRITTVWVLLIAATGLSWEFGHGLGVGGSYRLATTAVVLIAFIKVRFIFLDFMELRTAPLPLRLTFEGWSIIVCGTIMALYWTGA